MLPGGFDMEESARWAGHAAWIEMRLFEVMGRWVPSVPEADVKLSLATHAAHHAWHAELWREHMPRQPELDPDLLTGPPNDELVAFVDALAEPVQPEQTIEKLVGAYRVLLPHVIAAYSHHRRCLSPVSDGSALRALGFILQDEVDDWREGELHLQRRLTTVEDVGRAAAHRARLEELLVRAGGIAGPRTFAAPN